MLSIDETKSYSFPNKTIVQEPKRETSTTVPTQRNIKEIRKTPKMERDETDLDDALGETLTELSTRKSPVAIEMKLIRDS